MHHAHLYEAVADLPDHSFVQDADLVWVEVPVLDITTVRRIIEEASQKAFATDGVRFVAVICDSIRTEAQNALLKFLEEPPAHTELHFVIKNQSALLPTLLSRFEKNDLSKKSPDIDEAKIFLRLAPADRLELIAKKTSDKDLSWQQSLLDGLEQIIYTEPKNRELLPQVYFVRSRISAPGSSPKMLLEHLSLAYDELCN